MVWSALKRTTDVKKNSNAKTQLVMAGLAIAIASAVITSVWQIPQAAASSLQDMKVSRVINAHIDQVWNVVSGIDNETKYWSIFKVIKNIKSSAVNMTANTTEREVTIMTGPFGETVTHQFVTVNPEKFVVETNITQGPVTGT
ncbi:MAG: hypothetical protein M3247_06595, partial [Thermoproteota archaeon]|nr:hypothetical protein [Thermoproteota archaeon]